MCLIDLRLFVLFLFCANVYIYVYILGFLLEPPKGSVGQHNAVPAAAAAVRHGAVHTTLPADTSKHQLRVVGGRGGSP